MKGADFTEVAAVRSGACYSAASEKRAEPGSCRAPCLVTAEEGACRSPRSRGHWQLCCLGAGAPSSAAEGASQADLQLQEAVASQRWPKPRSGPGSWAGGWAEGRVEELEEWSQAPGSSVHGIFQARILDWSISISIVDWRISIYFLLQGIFRTQ